VDPETQPIGATIPPDGESSCDIPTTITSAGSIAS
jgi:hypothetical protein